ncbi:MAG TPA: hypothetical protein VMS37_11245 [Verrucomicrobiae bacterium]|nr:hypothetical protein [Verrucomicrobiae bacterium]
MRGGSAMLPLGESWAGLCRAVPGEDLRPDETALRQSCNLGYARRSCPRFPASDGPDAVRFTISSHQGDTLGIYYVVERDHHPFAHGALACSLTTGQWSPSPADDTLLRQAQAYVESYLRRRKDL